MGPKYLKDILTFQTEFTECITISFLDHRLMVLSLFTNNSFKLKIMKSKLSCKFKLRVSGYFDGEYRKICPWHVIDQKSKRPHHKHF